MGFPLGTIARIKATSDRWMNHSCTLVIEASGEPDYDPVTGAPIPGTGGSDTVIYDDKCQVNDEPFVVMRDESGVPTLIADASVRLPQIVDLGSVLDPEKITGTFRYNGLIRKGRITRPDYEETMTRIGVRWTDLGVLE